MEGGRESFHCPHCGKGFRYWVPKGVEQPKVKCSFCAKESFPNGEPPPPPPKPAEPPKPDAAQAPDSPEAKQG